MVSSALSIIFTLKGSSCEALRGTYYILHNTSSEIGVRIPDLYINISAANDLIWLIIELKLATLIIKCQFKSDFATKLKLQGLQNFSGLYVKNWISISVRISWHILVSGILHLRKFLLNSLNFVGCLYHLSID